MMRKPLLELTQLTRRFFAGEQELTVLKEINLTIYAGEMVAIVGQSGSGKSTLMNILGCLDRASSGSYRINGRATDALDTDELATLRRENFGFIFQRYHLLAHLTAAQNVEMPAIYAGIDTTQRRARARALLTRLGLETHIAHKPSQLSGGQQQRVSIARALMNGGDVILADEPTGALDSHSGKEVMAILSELHQLGHTIILVTHDMQVAHHAQRIIELQDGAIITDHGNHDHSTLLTTHGSAHIVQQKPVTNSALTRSFHASWGRFDAAFKMAWIAMATHRMRTFLTMLGMIIGIASVVSLVGIGQGAKQRVVNDIKAMGTSTVTFYPSWKNGEEDNPLPSTPMTLTDLAVIQQQFYVDSATPYVNSKVSLRYRNSKKTAWLTGVSEQYFRVKNVTLSDGAVFSKRDVQQSSQVIVIDHKTRAKLFPQGENPIGKIILVGSVPCTVIAVTKEKEWLFGNDDPNNLEVFVPYTTAMGRLLGPSNFISSITVRVRAGVPNDLAEQHLSQLISLRHGRKDFQTHSSDESLKFANKAGGIFTLVITAGAIISLFVGGIGVMNIMLVSVSERTHEIGIRMAVGARQNDIKQQFLIEAIVVCLAGGAIGVLISYVISALFPLFVQAITMPISLLSVVAACICCTLIGLTFGFFPARHAARLDPIEALARE